MTSELSNTTKTEETHWSSDAFDYARYAMSLVVNFGCIGLCLYAIGAGYAALPGHPIVLYCLFIFVLVLLAYLEGLQVAILALEHMPSENIKDDNSMRAYRCHKLATGRKGLNVQRFLIGRQFFVVFVVFLCAQLTTYPDLPHGDVPEWLFIGLVETGLPGALIVLAFGQLMPQLIASTHPVRFMNLPGAVAVVHLTLIFETIGITHFSWMLAAGVKRLFSCTGRANACDLEEGNAAAVANDEHKKGDDDKFSETDSAMWSQLKKELQTTKSGLLDLKAIYDSAEEGMGAEDIKSSRVAAEWLRSNGRGLTLYQSREEEVPQSPQTQEDPKKATLPSPADLVRHLIQKNEPVPRYLLPPHHPRHIPPHIVAFDMVRRFDALVGSLQSQRQAGPSCLEVSSS